MRFRFTGECLINDESSKNPYVRTGKTEKGNKYEAFSCGLKAAKNNAAWLELFGMESDKIKTMDANKNKIEIDWEDRFDDDVINQVANFKKNVININDERKEFVSSYDAVQYLVNNVDKMKGQRITITGQVNKNVYKGNFSDRFQIQNIYLAGEEDKNKFTCNDIFYFNKDSFDTADWRELKKLYINGWINTYISEEKKNMYVPQTLIFDCSKIDWDNEKHRKLVEFKLKVLKCSLTDDNKIKVGAGKNIYSMAVIATYNNGAEAEEIKEEDLTDAQKEAIELGLKKMSDFEGNVYGKRVTEFKLVDYNLTDDYSNGCIDTEISMSELEEELFNPKKEETLEEVMEKTSKADETLDEDDEDDDEDLFD